MRLAGSSRRSEELARAIRALAALQASHSNTLSFPASSTARIHLSMPFTEARITLEADVWASPDRSMCQFGLVLTVYGFESDEAPFFVSLYLITRPHVR